MVKFSYLEATVTCFSQLLTPSGNVKYTKYMMNTVEHQHTSCCLN